MADVSVTIVSVGYQGRSVGELIDVLRQGGVEVLVDVRLNPISRKPGFSKNPLSQALAEAGIGYRHERELGNPRERTVTRSTRSGTRHTCGRADQRLTPSSWSWPGPSGLRCCATSACTANVTVPASWISHRSSTPSVSWNCDTGQQR